MPLAIPTGGGLSIGETPASSIDLAAGSFVVAVLSAGGVTLTTAQLSVLGRLVTAASREIVRYCGNRPFALASYTEVVAPECYRPDRGDPATAKLKRFPVVAITRCATGRTTALSITNTSTANQEASVAFTFTGDAEFDNFVNTGLTLSRTASGTVTTNAVAWTTTSPYTTIAAVAASINALAGGWSATATTGGTPDVSLLPAAYLVGAREPRDALSATAALDVYATTCAASIERSSGILACRGLSRGYGFGGYGGCEDWGDEPPGLGWPRVEVRYTAGWATVPENLQLCCAEVVQLMLARVALDPSLKSETVGSYSWAARDAIGNLSDGAKATLNYYADRRI